MGMFWLGAALIGAALGLVFGAGAMLGSLTGWINDLGLAFGLFAYLFGFALLVGGCALMLRGMVAMGLRRYRKGRGNV